MFAGADLLDNNTNLGIFLNLMNQLVSNNGFFNALNMTLDPSGLRNGLAFFQYIDGVGKAGKFHISFPNTTRTTIRLIQEVIKPL